MTYFEILPKGLKMQISLNEQIPQLNESFNLELLEKKSMEWNSDLLKKYENFKICKRMKKGRKLKFLVEL